MIRKTYCDCHVLVQIDGTEYELPKAEIVEFLRSLRDREFPDYPRRGSCYPIRGHWEKRRST